MRFIDMFRMSLSNLWKRKMRTVLTVLGVVIGTASIVVMISIGLGLDRAVVEQMSEYGSMTMVNVYRTYGGYNENGEEDLSGYLSDETVETIRAMDHVECVSPVLSVSVIAMCGKYQSWINLQGMDPRMMETLGMELGQGTYPDQEASELQLIYGNNAIVDFYNPKSDGNYWMTGELPNVNLMEDNIFYIFDTDAYWSSQYNDGGEVIQPPKKYMIKTVGVVAGEVDEWSTFSYGAYCDIDQLIAQLKRIYKNKPIPGQPVNKAGKPYKQFYYDQVYVNVDDMDYVTDVQKQISALGYECSSNMEWVEYSQKQYSYIQTVLGGIGAVSLFVAAIGIANTMSMSIYERTKEIGVMKVLGCNIHNIQAMFLLEAAFIGLLGGIFGIGLSYGISNIMNHMSLNGNNEFGAAMSMSYIPAWLCMLGVGFAIVVGTIAGFFPSLRAMRLSPLAAIRNE